MNKLFGCHKKETKLRENERNKEMQASQGANADEIIKPGNKCMRLDSNHFLYLSSQAIFPRSAKYLLISRLRI